MVVTNNLDDIRPMLVRATWNSGTPIIKGNSPPEYCRHPDIYVSYYGAFFMIENRSGIIG